MPTGNQATNVNKNEEIDPRCIVKFRPADDWEGEYGFDWFREGDYGELLDNGEREDGTYNFYMINMFKGIKSFVDNNRNPIQPYYAIAKSDYKIQKSVGVYKDWIYICKYNRVEKLYKKDFTDSTGKRLYMDDSHGPIHERNKQYLALLSHGYCKSCPNKGNCRVQYGKPLISEITNKPCKVDPDEVGRYLYQPPQLEYDLVDNNGNIIGNYADNLITDCYSKIVITPNQEYIVPTVSLFYKNVNKNKNWGKSDANIKLLIYGKNIDVDKDNIILEFETSEGIEKLNNIPCSTTNKNQNTNYYETIIKVNLTEMFRDTSIKNGDGAIKVYAYNTSDKKRTLAGKLIVEKCIPKSINIVFVPIAVQLQSGISHYPNSMEKEKEWLKKRLHQAHIITGVHSSWAHLFTDIPTLVFYSKKSLDILYGNKGIIENHKDKDSNGNVRSDEIKLFDDNNNFLITELEILFNKEFPDLKNAYKIFFIGAKSHDGYTGMGRNIPSKSAVIFQNNDDKNTVCHELFHCLGLFHSFSNNSPHTYEKQKTSNIMDYGSYKGLSLVSSWKWQWKKIREQLDYDYIKSSLSPLLPIIKY